MVLFGRDVCQVFWAYLSHFLVQYTVCHMMLFFIDFSNFIGYICIWCVLLGKYFEMHLRQMFSA